MLSGVSTAVISSKETSLIGDIKHVLEFGLECIEVVPKSLDDLSAGIKLRDLLASQEHRHVILPAFGAISGAETPEEYEGYIRKGLQFASDIGASLLTIGSIPSDLGDTLLRVVDEANQSIPIALMNGAASTEFCTPDQIRPVIEELNWKLTLDICNAHFGMGRQLPMFIGEQKDRIAAVRASDATEAFSSLPLGSGHINYPLIVPALEAIGFRGPYYITHARFASQEKIIQSRDYLEYLEL